MKKMHEGTAVGNNAQQVLENDTFLVMVMDTIWRYEWSNLTIRQSDISMGGEF